MALVVIAVNVFARYAILIPSVAERISDPPRQRCWGLALQYELDAQRRAFKLLALAVAVEAVAERHPPIGYAGQADPRRRALHDRKR